MKQTPSIWTRLAGMMLALLLLVTAVVQPLPAKAVEPEKPQVYVFDLEAFLNSQSSSKIQYDYLKTAAALQGLANRERPTVFYLYEENGFKVNGVKMDDFWLNELSQPGQYLADYEQVKVADFFELIEKVSAAAKIQGTVLWDEKVPATANVATTIAGVENLIPIRYDTAETSVYTELLVNRGFFGGVDGVKKNLVGMFTGTGTIPGSQTPSTGSAKNDAYLWAKEQYLDKGLTSKTIMGYNQDAWCKVGYDGMSAVFTKASLPATMTPGEEREVSLEVLNNSNETWTFEGNYRIASLYQGANSFQVPWAEFGTDQGSNPRECRIFLDKTNPVEPGETFHVRFKIKAPDQPGNYFLNMGVVHDGVAWLAGSVKQNISVISGAKPSCEFKEVTLPNAMEPGATADVTMTIVNHSQETFSRDQNYRIASVSGRSPNEPQNAFTIQNPEFGGEQLENPHECRIYFSADAPVAPGTACTLHFQIQAPQTPGAAVLALGLVHDGRAWFNDSTFIHTIDVKPGADSTPVTVTASGELVEYVYQVGSDEMKYDLSTLLNYGVINQDYYIKNKAFCFDLSPDKNSLPIDDRAQQLGTDYNTFCSILQSQQTHCGGELFSVTGFVPWHAKYTKHCDPQASLHPVAAEWKMVDILSTYGGEKDADAMSMVGLANASLYSQIPLNELRQKNDKNAIMASEQTKVPYDKDAIYFTVYMGDYDCGAWTSGVLPSRFLVDEGEEARYPLMWPVAADLSNRVPHAYNWVYSHMTENDYFVAGDNGTGYLNPMLLNDGMLEKWKNHNIEANRRFDLDVQGCLIAGNSGSLSAKVQQAYSEMTPWGVVHIGGAPESIVGSTPFVESIDTVNHATNGTDYGNIIYRRLLGANRQFVSLRSIVTDRTTTYEALDQAMARAQEDGRKIYCVDPYTMLELFRLTNGGTTPPPSVEYAAKKTAAPITVDGTANTAEWQWADEISVSPVSKIVTTFGNNWAPGSCATTQDLDVVYKLRWDAENLYLLEDRRSDDSLVFGTAGMMTNEDMYTKDGTMLFLSLDQKHSGSTYLEGDYAMVINPSTDGTVDVMLRTGHPDGAATEELISTCTVSVRTREDQKGYVMEIAIPWSTFGTVRPAENLTGAMTVMALDQDAESGWTQIMWAGNGDAQEGWAAMTLAPAAAEELEKPAIANFGQSLSLDDNIFINSYVTVTGYEQADIEQNGGMLIWNAPISEENAVFGAAGAVNKAGLTQITTKEGDVVYGQQTDGIVSTDYAKTLYLRSYVKNTDGTYTYGPLTQYSVRTYVDKAIAQNSTAKNAAIELAHFGAAAQLYFGRNLDKLANSGMEQYPAGEFKPEYLDALADFTTSIQNSGNVTYKGKTLSLDDRIMMNFYFMPDGFDVKSAELLIWDGVTGELTETNATKTVDMILTQKGYGAQALGFAANEYGKTIFVCAKMTDTQDNVHYSAVAAASPESYAQDVIDRSSNAALIAAVRQMVVYGEAAGVYLAAKQ